jgi:predicted  nucleic acid-binding Zn-ribbon protein
MKAHTLDLDPAVGFENMRSLAAIRDEAARDAAQRDLRDGHSPDMVKMKYGRSRAPKDPREALQAERERLEKSIERMKKQLQEIEKRLQELGEE